MKKLLLILLISGFSFTQAQVTIGIKTDYNLSRIAGDWEDLLEDYADFNLETFNIELNFDPKFKGGFNAGVYAEILISENFYLQPELMYSLKGVRFDDSFDFEGEFGGFYADVNGDYEYRQSLHYLELPVFAKYKSNGGFILFGGPYIAYLLSAKGELIIDATYTTNAFGFPFSGNQEIERPGLEKENFKKIDFGIAGGIGYEFPFGLGINARYVKGLINISEDLEDEMYTNSSMQFGVYYKIVGFDKKE
ncbi:MAG: porin family protein [Bacteroidia bacterium]